MENKGYEINNTIATVTPPQLVSLSSTPNYVTISRRKNAIAGGFVRATIKVINTEITISSTIKEEEEKEKYIAEHSTIKFIETNNSVEHSIKGTKNANNVNNSTYFINNNKAITAENIKDCLMKNSFLSSNFQIIKGFEEDKETGKYNITDTITLQSLGKGNKYAITFKENNKNELLSISTVSSTSNDDSIDKGSGQASIELEVYTVTPPNLGEEKFPENSLGTYITTLSKSYFGEPLWFNLNALMENKSTFSNEFLTGEGWCDAGTATGYRFIARRFDGKNREPFYLSNMLYNITGYNRNLEGNNLKDYVFDMHRENVVKPLTNKCELTHIYTPIVKDEKGNIISKHQSQYLNFILSDTKRETYHGIGIFIKFYSQSKIFLADGKMVYNNKLATVNTLKIQIDKFIDLYKQTEPNKQVGFVEIYLAKKSKPMSTPLTFRILPTCLHKVNDFAFLNALGGWSSFNFGGEQQTDFKTSTNTVFKTQLPTDTVSDQIESVFTKEVKEQFVVETNWIDKDTVNWLKEMSTSIAVYELSTGRYVVVEDMKIKPNTKDDLFKVEMKYHYSDSYNGLI